MHKYGLHGKLTAKKGQGDELAQILLEAAKLVSTANGCLIYMISKDEANPESVWITEAWESELDHDNSLSVPGVRELIGKAMPILDGAPQKGQELKILGGLGID